MLEVWVVATLLMGTPAQVTGTPEFNARAGCELYRHNVYGEELTQSFKLVCVVTKITVKEGKI